MTKKKSFQLTLTALAAGAAAAVLRYFLYAAAVDDRGLLIKGHPLEIAGWALLAALLGALYFLTNGLSKTRLQVPVGPVPGAGSILLALGLAAAALHADPRFSLMKIAGMIAWLAAACMIFSGISRFQKKRPFFLLMVVPCIFFILYLVGLYQVLRGIPQIGDCLPAVGAAVSMLMLSYHQAAMDLHSSNVRSQVFYSGLTVFFCLTCLAEGRNPVFYACGAGWAGLNLLTLREERKD